MHIVEFLPFFLFILLFFPFFEGLLLEPFFTTIIFSFNYFRSIYALTIFMHGQSSLLYDMKIIIFAMSKLVLDRLRRFAFLNMPEQSWPHDFMRFVVWAWHNIIFTLVAHSESNRNEINNWLGYLFFSFFLFVLICFMEFLIYEDQVLLGFQ